MELHRSRGLFAFGAIAERGYIDRFADYIEADRGEAVAVRNLSVPGWRSADLLLALQTDSTMRGAVAEANVVTWDIGGNDLGGARARYLEGSCGGSDNKECLRQAVAQLQSNWRFCGVTFQLSSFCNPGDTMRSTQTSRLPALAIRYTDDSIGREFPKHRHLGQDEIVFIQSGNARFTLTGKDYEVHDGGMTFAPMNTWDVAGDDIQLIFIYSAPGFEEYITSAKVTLCQTGKMTFLPSTSLVARPVNSLTGHQAEK